MHVLNLVMITLCVVIVVDISGFINSLKTALGKYLKTPPDRINIKPLSCSFCMTHWTNLIYLICSGELTLGAYLFTLVLAYITPVFADALLGVREFLQRMTAKIK